MITFSRSRRSPNTTQLLTSRASWYSSGQNAPTRRPVQLLQSQCPPVASIADVEAALLSRPDRLAATVAEKLLTYALGRPVDWRDAAAIRGIVRSASEDDYRFGSIVRGVVASEPFQH